jgi:hypothetical protein
MEIGTLGTLSPSPTMAYPQEGHSLSESVDLQEGQSGLPSWITTRFAGMGWPSLAQPVWVQEKENCSGVWRWKQFGHVIVLGGIIIPQIIATSIDLTADML